MQVTKFGFTYTADLHGMTVESARRELVRLLNSCPKEITEVEVIHGQHGGTALMNTIRREFKHPRLERKILGLNGGMTTLVLKKQ